MFTIYKIVLGWRTSKCYDETDELPNPRPTEPKIKQVTSGVWATFFPTANIFSRVGIDVIKKTRSVSDVSRSLQILIYIEFQPPIGRTHS